MFKTLLLLLQAFQSALPRLVAQPARDPRHIKKSWEALVQTPPPMGPGYYPGTPPATAPAAVGRQNNGNGAGAGKGDGRAQSPGQYKLGLRRHHFPASTKHYLHVVAEMKKAWPSG